MGYAKSVSYIIYCKSWLAHDSIDPIKVRISELEAKTTCECEQRTAIEGKCGNLRGELRVETENAKE